MLDHIERDANRLDYHHQTPLSLAAENGHEVILKAILELDSIEVNKPDKDGNTPLHYAAGNGRMTTASLLLEREDVDPNHKNCSGDTPLHLAASNGCAMTASLFAVREDVDLNCKNCRRSTPLSEAVKYNHKNVVKLFLECGSHRAVGNIPLLAACTEAEKDVRFQRIINVQVDAMDEQGRTPLFKAMRRGYWDVAKLLVRHGADTTLRDGLGCTALGLSILSGKVADHETILMCNADPIVIEWTGQKIQYAASSLRRILEQHVGVDHLGKIQAGHFFHATTFQAESLVRAMLEIGADVNMYEYGEPALFRTIQYLECFKVMVEFGADVNAWALYEGRTALMELTRRGTNYSWFLDRARLLINAGAEINARDDCGQNVLFYALQSPRREPQLKKVNLKILQWLVQKGASVDIKNREGKTPLDVALSRQFEQDSNYEELLRLLSHGVSSHGSPTPSALSRLEYATPPSGLEIQEQN